MKLKDICLSAMFLVVAQPALAAETSKKPVTHWTCADFLSIDDQFKPKVVYAATSHVKGKSEAVIDIEGTEKVIPAITAECQKKPQSAFLRELEGAWDKVEADTKAGMKAIEKKM
jgi:acid stress chaperone HdeA